MKRTAKHKFFNTKRQSNRSTPVTVILIDLHSYHDDHHKPLHHLHTKLGNKLKPLLNYMRARQEFIQELTNQINSSSEESIHKQPIPVEFALDHEVLRLAWQSKCIFFPSNSVNANDRSLIVKMMKENPKIFQFIHQFYRNDKQILELAKHEPTNYEFLPTKIKNEPEVFIPQCHSSFRDEIKDEEFVRRYIKLNPKIIAHSPHINNLEMLKEAIRYGFFTTSEIVPNEWKSDKEFMLQAISKNPIWYGGGVSETLLKDKDFVEKIARMGVKIYNINYFEEEFQEVLVEINPHNISFIVSSTSPLLNDKNLVLKYLSKAKFFRNISPTLKGDIDIISEALRYGDLNALEYAPIEVWRNLKNLFTNLKGVDIGINPPDFIKNEKEVIDFLIDNGNISCNFKAWGIDNYNPRVLLRILKNTRGSFFCIVPEKVKNDQKFIRKLIRLRPDFIRDIPLYQTIDSLFILELCKLNPYCYAHLSISQNMLEASHLTGLLYSKFDCVDDFNSIVKRQLKEKYDMMKIPELFTTFHIA